MAAIIENDIRGPEFIDNALQKVDIRLASDPDFDLILIETAAFRVDINTDDLGVWTEVPFPHLQRSSPAASNFDKEQGAVNVTTEMGFISRKIMFPLMNPALIIVEELRP
jgi:hypothetical protein